MAYFLSKRIQGLRLSLIFLVAIFIAILVGGKAWLVINQRIAERFVERGTSYLIAQDYPAAAQEYQKALRYNSQAIEAEQDLAIIHISQIDIAQAKSFYVEHKVTSVLQKLSKAQATFTNPKQAVAVGVQFYANQDYVYAQYPLQQAVNLDPGYPEAWHYLALTYQKLGKIDSSYTKKADEAFLRQNELTPKYLNLK